VNAQVVVADTDPLHDLLLIDLLPRLFAALTRHSPSRRDHDPHRGGGQHPN
jgi:hypothetical protein